MKKIYYWLCVLLISNMPISAQNLVTNPGFENVALGHSDFGAIGWTGVMITPDLFAPQKEAGWQTPTNFAGYQTPFDGTNYAGMMTYTSNSIAPNRELLQNDLMAALQPGTRYFFSVYLSLADWIIPTYSSPPHNKLGVRFSVNPYVKTTNEPPIDNFAHIYSDNFYTDQNNWMLYTGSFVADSAYEYMTLGCFFTNSMVDTINGGGPALTYYYFDHVCLSPDSLVASQWYLGVEDETVSLWSSYPNPFHDEVNIKAPGAGVWDITIYNHLSQVVYTGSYETELKIPGSELTSGMLYYEIRNNNGELFRGKMLKS